MELKKTLNIRKNMFQRKLENRDGNRIILELNKTHNIRESSFQRKHENRGGNQIISDQMQIGSNMYQIRNLVL